MAQEELKAGDIVQLKTGSFKMIIGSVGNGYAICYWEIGGLQLKHESIHIACLEKVS